LFNERKSQAYKPDSNARTRHFADTQQHVAAMKDKWPELNQAPDDTWEQIVIYADNLLDISTIYM